MAKLNELWFWPDGTGRGEAYSILLAIKRFPDDIRIKNLVEALRQLNPCYSSLEGYGEATPDSTEPPEPGEL